MGGRTLMDGLAGLAGSAPPVVAVVRLAGVIGGFGPVRRGLSLATLAPTLERAFGLRRLKAVALAVNSPGGSPVQASLIRKRIRALSAEKKVPVYAFAEDVAASGGYWLACAGDEIFVESSSIVGSIGVVTAGFGFVDAIRRLGIRRRLYTSGERKAMLDPFLTEDPKDVARLKAIQREIHESFKATVRESRGSRLRAPEAELFSGEVWTGARAVELGLADGIGDLRTVMRERYGERVRLRVVGGERSWLRRRLPFLGRGAPFEGAAGDWAGEMIAALEERALWSRFGL